MDVLELFSGSGIMAETFNEYGFNTTTIDNDPKRNPDYCIDISKGLPDELMKHYYVIWASPPCTRMSINSHLRKHWNPDKTPRSKECKDSYNLIRYTLYLIQKLNQGNNYGCGNNYRLYWVNWLRGGRIFC